jgi:NADH-quinone oxidoreductase subunit F
MGGSGGDHRAWTTRVNMVEALANINAFYAHESCGQCTPCREGSLWMKKITTRMVHGAGARRRTPRLLKNVADQIAGRTICAFGEACSWPTAELYREVRRRIQSLPGNASSRRARRRCRSSESASTRHSRFQHHVPGRPTRTHHRQC